MVQIQSLVWFIINELISILENIGRMGTEFPEFLKNILADLKDNLDDKKSNKRWESFIHAPIIPLITVDFQLVNLPYYYGL